MPRQTPVVQRDVLLWRRDDVEHTVVVGTEDWFVWLDTAATFAFTDEEGSFTAYKERRQRGGWYWKAYRKRRNRLHRFYLGKSEDLTLERLRVAAAALAKEDIGAHQLSDANQDGQPSSMLSQRSSLTFPTATQSYPPNGLQIELLTTKMTAPPPRAALIPRPRLYKRLDRALETRLTLVVAPAGFGKTTLVSAWANNFGFTILDFGLNQPQPNPKSKIQNPKCGWFSLDDGDNDPTRFWMYVIAALERVHPNVGEVARMFLQAPQQFPINRVLTALVNDLASVQTPTVLILDDYHLITNDAIHQGIAFLIDHLPHTIHLLIAGRATPPLPLTRLRGRGQITELHAADLQCTTAEATALLQDALAINLSEQDIAALVERTEGWMVGLQLVALSLSAHGDARSFIATLSGNNRYIWDYLIGEVFEQQPGDVQQFLLDTSILDRLSGPLCDAVMERQKVKSKRQNDDTDSRELLPFTFDLLPSQQMLEYLEQHHLFTIPLDTERRWYRYHHLFAEVLRERLRRTQPDLIAGLHRRAAHWYEQHGYMIEAVDHALAAEDAPYAAQLMEQVAHPLLMRGEMTTLLRWFDALPDDIIRTSPRLCVAHAWIMLLSRSVEALESRLQDADYAIVGAQPSTEIDQLRAEIATLRALIAMLHFDLSHIAGLVDHATAALSHVNPFTRGMMAFTLGTINFIVDNNEVAQQQLFEAARSAQESGSTFVAVASLMQLGDVLMWTGQLHAAETYYRQSLQLAVDQQGRPLPIATGAYAGLGELLREWNDLDSAEHHLTEGFALGHPMAELNTLDSYVAMARVCQARGKSAEAIQLIQRAIEIARAWSDASFADEFLTLHMVRLWVHQGNLQQAESWARQPPFFTTDHALRVLYEVEALTLARVRLAQERFDEALTILEPVSASAEKGKRTRHIIETLLLQALAYNGRGEAPQAIRSLTQALTLAEPEGFVRIFADEGAPMAALLGQVASRKPPVSAYARQLLLAFGDWRLEIGDSKNDSSQSPISNLQSLMIEPLSPRELGVLRLIAEGQSNQDIARTLIISTGTVKVHTRNIYGKLGVGSRSQAIAKARELGLLG
jgi:LuxR family maltose regulon positive regulatory protein